MTQERTQLIKELEAGLDWQSIQLSRFVSQME